MKILYIFLLAICLPILTVGQTTSADFKGRYRFLSIKVFGGEGYESQFEVGASGEISGKIMTGEKNEVFAENLQGSAKPDGKFEASAVSSDGAILTLSGKLPGANLRGMISFSVKKVVKSKSSKSVSENKLTGFIEKIFVPVIPAPIAEVKVANDGKTRLLLQNAPILFASEWIEPTVTISELTAAGKTFQVIEIKSESADSLRFLRFALPAGDEKKIWLAEEKFAVSYRETKDSEKKTFMFSRSGSIEILSESGGEILWKITNLQLKQSGGTGLLRIDGFVSFLK